MNPPLMRDAVVADASLAVEWFVLEAFSEEARELLATWNDQGIRCFVPSWFACEVSNVLYKNVLRNVIDVSEAKNVIRRLMAAVSVRDLRTGDLRPRAWIGAYP